jgi:hypothetical protein
MSHEDDRASAESNRIGAESNRIGAESARVTAGEVREGEYQSRESTRRKREWGQLGAYLLFVIFGLVGFWEMQRVDQNFCEAGTENREAVRNLTMAISSLGVDLVTEGKAFSELSPQERDAVQRFRAFERKQLALLELPICP